MLIFPLKTFMKDFIATGEASKTPEKTSGSATNMKFLSWISFRGGGGGAIFLKIQEKGKQKGRCYRVEEIG